MERYVIIRKLKEQGIERVALDCTTENPYLWRAIGWAQHGRVVEQDGISPIDALTKMLVVI